MNTHTINTQALQKKFPEVYREFFSRFPVVLSTPLAFHWTGEYSMLFGGIGIMQKLPTVCYVGLEPAQEWIWEDYLAYNPKNDSYEIFELDDNIRQNFLDFLKEETKKLGGGAFRIGVLCELPPGSGLHSSGAISASLASGLMIMYNEINPEELSVWQTQSLKALKDDKKFQKVRRLAWKLDALFYADRASGDGSFNGLVQSEYPIIYFTEPRTGSYSKHPNTRIPHDVEGHYEVYDDVIYWAFRLNELFNLPSRPTWSIDFGLIFTGSYKRFNTAIGTIEDIHKEFQKDIDTAVHTFKPELGTEKILPSFYEMAIKDKEPGLWKRYNDILNIISIEAMDNLKEIFEHGASPSACEAFFRSLNLFQAVLYLLNLNTPVLDHIVSSFLGQAQKISEGSIGIKISSAGRGGDLIFATSYDALGEKLFDIVEDISRQTQRDMVVHYVSWRDGYGKKGTSVDQYLEKDIFSPFITRGSYSVHIWDGGREERKLESLQAFEKEKADCDLVFDGAEHKIWVGGRATSSKEIHSVSATNEIFGILLKNAGQAVSNMDLPRSTYSTNRNDFHSKILIPLASVVKKRVKAKLNLTITGSLDRFFITFLPDDFKVAVVEKIF